MAARSSELKIYKYLEEEGMRVIRAQPLYMAHRYLGVQTDRGEKIVDRNQKDYWWEVGDRSCYSETKKRRINDDRYNMNIYHRNRSGDATGLWVDIFFKAAGGKISVYRIECGNAKEIVIKKRVRRRIPIRDCPQIGVR